MYDLWIWARRWSTARGWTWQKERNCANDTAEEWLAVFKKSEPEIEFVLSKAKPR